MRKQIIEYTSPIDALVALTKQLYEYEIQYKMDSAEFFAKYSQGETSDDEVFIEWAGDYQHYLAVHPDKLSDTVITTDKLNIFQVFQEASALVEAEN